MVSGHGSGAPSARPHHTGEGRPWRRRIPLRKAA
jgi:hypothetical protein